ncbi:MAG: sodium/proline symporter [Planctomycetaceae bacterium]|nr:sodium/proline symporter [Planctomycetaceae bacterium]
MAVIVTLVLYILVMIGIGVYYSKRASGSEEEYYLGGRSMGPLVTAVASGSTGRSAWLILGMVGTGYLFGAGSIWSVGLYALTELFAMAYAGKRLRIFTEKMNNLTWPDYLESRLEDKSNLLRLTAVLIIVVFYICYIGAQLKGSTKMFSFLFGMEPVHAIILSAVVVMIYTMTGGYRAVMMTSFIQGLLMLVSLVILPLYLFISNVGTGIVGRIMAIEPMLLNSPAGAASNAWIAGMVLIAFGSWGQVHILTRYMSTNKVSEMNKAAIGNAVWNVVCAAGACFTGLLARLVWESQSALPNSDPELITVVISSQLMNPVVGGIIIAGIVSAIMSTIDQLLLTTTSAITRDLYQAIINKDASDRKIVQLSRIVMVVCSAVAIGLALSDSQTIYWFVLFAFGGLGAAFGPIFILSTYWKGMTKWGAFVGMVSGLIITVLWYYTPSLKNMIYELVPAFIVSMAANIIVSKLTSKDRPGNVDALFAQLSTYTDA